MVQIALKKKESRLLWEVLFRGIQDMDQTSRKTPPSDQEAYQELRGKVLTAWKSGLIVGGLRPKRRVYDIMPSNLLKDAELAVLKKADRRAKAKTKREIAVPNQVPRARNASGPSRKPPGK